MPINDDFVSTHSTTYSRNSHFIFVMATPEVYLEKCLRILLRVDFSKNSIYYLTLWNGRILEQWAQNGWMFPRLHGHYSLGSALWKNTDFYLPFYPRHVTNGFVDGPNTNHLYMPNHN